MDYSWLGLFAETQDFQQESGGYRDVPASELVGELELTPLVEINFFISFYFPISEKSFKLSAENVKDISLVYTDVKNITDIRDTSGDGKGLTTQVVIRNVFGYDMDISDLVEEANNSVNGSGDVSDRFKDVKRDAWYHDAAQWVVDIGIMNGVSDTLFAPNNVATRAMVVTMVWRMAGQPAVNYALPYTDVPEGRWYTEAIRWAASTGTVNGTGADTFSPNAPVTREQLVAILYRYVQAQGEGFEGAWAFPLDFSDAASVSEWADEAMHWMTMNGIISGMGNGRLAPKDNAARAQIAAVFMRFCEAG